jgi:hypothetical protein
VVAAGTVVVVVGVCALSRRSNHQGHGRLVSVTRPPITLRAATGPCWSPPATHLVVPVSQTVEERRMDHDVRNVPSPDGSVGAVPSSAATTDLDFGTVDARRRAHHGGTDVAPDVDDDGSRFAGPQGSGGFP